MMPAPGPAGCRHLLQDRVVLLDVLQHVECRDHIEFIAERNRLGVHAVQGGSGHAAGRRPQALDGKFPRGQLQSGERARHIAQHDAVAATDFERCCDTEADAEMLG